MGTVVAVVGSRVEAEMAVGTLQSHGIRARISGDDAGGVDPALQAQGVRVLTADEDADAARRILGNDGAPDAPPPPLNGLQRWVVRLLGGSGPRS